MLIQIQILTLVAACTVAASTGSAAERPTIGLVTEFPDPTPPALLQEFRQETERALQSAGADFAWREWPGLPSFESFDRLVIIRFQGDCMAPPPSNLARRAPLGLAHVSEGTVLPFVEINCPRVLQTLEDSNLFGGPRYESAVGRALGRVAAHEIHHVLTGNSKHDRDGLMRPVLSARDLLRLILDFSKNSVNQLKASLGTAD